MFFTDTGHITSGRERTAEGFLKVNARIARAGIQEYYVFEFPDGAIPPNILKGRQPTDKIRLLRPESEVFKPASVITYRNKTITNAHPKEFVDADNVKQLQVGTSTSEIEARGGFVRGQLIIQDASAIKDVEERGRQEISAGYSADTDWTPGTDPVDGYYDGIQRNIEANHIALVDRARAGSQVRLEDGETFDHAPPKKEENTVQIIVDGIPIDYTDGQPATVMQKVLAERDAARDEVKGMTKQYNDAVAERDTLQGKLDVATKQMEDPKRLHQMAAERAQLLDHARSIDPEAEIAPEHTNLDIKRAIVAKASGEDTSKAKEPYLDGALSMLAPALAAQQAAQAQATQAQQATQSQQTQTQQTQSDGGLGGIFRDAAQKVTSRGPVQLSDADKQLMKDHESYHESLRNAWKPKGGN